MSVLSEITLTHFRNFDLRTFSFSGPVVGIAGKNGTGKTNLLDAIYYLCYTKSYFQPRDINIVQTGKEGFRLEGKWMAEQKKGPRSTVCKWKAGKKTIFEDGVELEKASLHIGNYLAVMIAPDDIDLINSGSEGRRKFIDGLLAQYKQEYLEHLLAYQRLLNQRNAYLKSAIAINNDLLDTYDSQLSQHGAELIRGRLQVAARLPEWLRGYYEQLSGSAEQVHAEYQPACEPDQLLELFRHYRSRDIQFKRTTSGPHTEDWRFTLNGLPLKTHGSQGQKKSFLISLKLAQARWIQSFDQSALLLLDDIFEKLDPIRLERLFGLLPDLKFSQIFLTHTSASDCEKLLIPYYNTLEMISLS